MKSYKVVASGASLELHESERPVPKGKQVLIKTIACGVCHTDIHIHDGYFDLGNDNHIPSRMNETLTMGHEIYGELIEVGSDVSNVEIGKKYVVYPWIGCGECNECERDMEHYCSPFTAENLGVSVDGGYGEYVLVKDSKYLFDAGNTPDELAGTYACRGLTAYSALKKANLDRGDSVVIISAGGLGLLALKIAIAAFEVNAIVVDIDNEKLSIAKKIGASEVINSKDEGAASKIMEILGGAASTILDFVGSEESVNFGYSLFGINKGGLYVLIGLLGGKFDLPLPLHTFTARTITGTYVGSMKEMKELMDLVREGRIEPLEVETRPVSKASDTLADLKAGKIKGLVCLKH
ncbi:alcohol dehydrogenase [Gammaproteobacteria bacterium]|nr:alcohol dehydrogenase [Gammaproteobacteria bacterium]